jgi:hypothetical protein
MANRQIIDIGTSGNFNIDLGQICDGDTVSLQFCNSGETATFAFGCSCPALDGLPTEPVEIESCHCETYQLTYRGNGYPGLGSCLIIVRVDDIVVRINVTWEEVYCDITTTAWSLDDASEIVEIDSTNFNADCEVFYGSCMANRNIFSITHTLAQPLIVGDEIFFSQWLCAQIVNWDYQNYPIAGWKYRACLGEEENVDGTFEMEWYGEQPSEENSADSPYVECIVGGGGTTITITIEFNMPADTTQAPGNNGQSVHDVLLKNSVRNGLEIDNESENSVYRNPKYMTWATVVYRSIGQVYQDAIFSIKAELPFYNEMSVTGSVMQLTLNSVTLQRQATLTDTDYLSTTRPTKVIVDFDYISANVAGTPPNAMWVYMIRNDAQNDQLDYYDNYEYEQADLTTLAASLNITPTVAPTSVTGNNFTAEFDIAPLHIELEGVNSIALNYRFIFVAMSAVDQETRSTISEQIQLINYDDEPMPLNTLELVWRTVEQEYASNVQTLSNLPVNMDLESGLRIDLPATNAELMAKTTGKVNDASQALKSIRLDVYEENPLTGNLLLDTMFFQPETRRECDANFGNGEIIDDSVGGNIDLNFPFTIPDNIYRQIGREGLFQRVDGQLTRVPVRDVSLDCVIATQTNLCSFGTSFGTMSSGVANARYSGELQYIPATQEVWALDAINSEIHIYDANSFQFVVAIPIVTTSPVYMEYVLSTNSVYVSGNNSGSVICVDINTRTVTATIAIGAPTDSITGLKYISQTQELIVVNRTTEEIERINVNTNAVVGTPIALGAGTGAQEAEYIPQINEIWVSCAVSNTIERVNYTTFAHAGSIAVSSAFAIKLVGNEIWVGRTSIDVVNITTFAVITSIAITYQFQHFTEFGGVIYTGSSSGVIDTVFGYDTVSYNQVTALYIGANSRPTFILLANGILYVGSGASASDTIYLFDADCQQQLPPYSMRNRNILFDWQLEFQIFDNTEIYHAFQSLERPQGSIDLRTIDPKDFMEDVEVVFPSDLTPTPTPIDDATPCATTGVINVNAKWGANTSNRELFGVALEVVPFRGGMLSSESSDPVAGNIIIPIDSPFIKNLTPVFGVNADINFDIDYPGLPIEGDYEIIIHFLIRP